MISSSATWRLGFRPPFRPMILPSRTHGTIRHQPGREFGRLGLFRLGVVPDRDYRLELRVPETTDGRPANVGFIVFRGYMPYFDLGDVDEGPGVFSTIFGWWTTKETAISASSSKRHAFMKSRGATFRPDCSLRSNLVNTILSRGTSTPLC